MTIINTPYCIVISKSIPEISRLKSSTRPIIIDRSIDALTGVVQVQWEKLTFSSTVFLIFTLASTTVFPALFTALYKNPPRLFAPASAFVETSGRQETKIRIDVMFPVREGCPLPPLTRGTLLKQENVQSICSKNFLIF